MKFNFKKICLILSIVISKINNCATAEQYDNALKEQANEIFPNVICNLIAQYAQDGWDHGTLARLKFNHTTRGHYDCGESMKALNKFIDEEIDAKGFSINQKDNNGKTLLMKSLNYAQAFFSNNFSIKYNLDLACYLTFIRNANVNIQDKDGNTALKYALDHGYFDFILTCMMHGCVDFSIENNEGQTLLDSAEEKFKREGDSETIQSEYEKYLKNFKLSELIESIKAYKNIFYNQEIFNALQNKNERTNVLTFDKESMESENTEFYFPPFSYECNEIHNLIAEYCN